jgi:hypothetical protein
MIHWHIAALNDLNRPIRVDRFDDAGESIWRYLNLAYQLFPSIIDKEDRPKYLEGMFILVTRDMYEGYHVHTNTKNLTLSWMDCEDDPCTFGTYN